jgi:hypothetical protein
MNNDELKNMIESYFDGELDKNSEPILFTLLSADPEGRQYFKHLHALQLAVIQSAEPFPALLEQNILDSIKTVRTKSYGYNKLYSRASQFISISLAAVLFIICSFLFFELKDYKSKVQSISDQVNEQKETIDVILNNSYPAVVVSPDAKNEIIIRANSRRKI